MRTLAVVAVSMAGIGLTLTACSSSSNNSNGSSDQTLVLYNAQHEQTTNALIAGFEKATGIKVKTDNGDEDELTAKIENEGSRSPADLVYTENSNWLVQLDQKGLLSHVDDATLASVPKQDSATDGNWVGVSARVSALVYNTTSLSAAKLPTKALQMADPEWKNKIEIAPSETDFWPVVASMDKAYGDAATINWLKGLKENAGSGASVPDNETLTSDVNLGTTQLALINHYYFYRLEAEVGKASGHAALAYLAPQDPGYVQSISGAAILKSSTHQAAAQKFLQYIAGEDGQRILEHSNSFEYPIHPGVPANAAMPPLASLHPNDFSPADLGTGLQAKKLLQEAGLI